MDILSPEFQDNLMANWELAVNGRATFTIKGLDQ